MTRKKRWMFMSLGALILAIVVVLMLQPSAYDSSAPVGSRGRLIEEDAATIPVAKSLDDLRQLVKVRIAGDALSVVQMQSGNRIWLVPSGSVVEVIGAVSRARKVRLMDGKEGWVPDFSIAEIREEAKP